MACVGVFFAVEKDQLLLGDALFNQSTTWVECENYLSVSTAWGILKEAYYALETIELDKKGIGFQSGFTMVERVFGKRTSFDSSFGFYSRDVNNDLIASCSKTEMLDKDFIAGMKLDHFQTNQCYMKDHWSKRQGDLLRYHRQIMSFMKKNSQRQKKVWFVVGDENSFRFLLGQELALETASVKKESLIVSLFQRRSSN